MIGAQADEGFVHRRFRLSLIRHALFGEDSMRFAAMLGLCELRNIQAYTYTHVGSFVGLYKFLLNALPILVPQPNPDQVTHARTRSLFRASITGSPEDTLAESPFEEEALEEIERAMPQRKKAARHARLSMNAQAHQLWVRKRTRWWYSAFAGTVAGAIAIMFEKRSRRVGIAQQMFVRYVVIVVLRLACSWRLHIPSGLQGSFNAMSDKHGFKIPHGDVLVFTLWSVSCSV